MSDTVASNALNEKYFDVFKKNYLVIGLPEDAIHQLADLADYRVETAGSVLVQKGSQSGDLFVVLDGDVTITTGDGDLLGKAGPGSVFGEIALVDDQPRSANVVCPGLTAVARFPAKELRSFMAKNREIGFVMLANLARLLAFRLRNTTTNYDELRDKIRDPWEHSI